MKEVTICQEPLFSLVENKDLKMGCYPNSEKEHTAGQLLNIKLQK